MPHGPVVHMTITDLTDGDGKPVEAARHAQETVYLKNRGSFGTVCYDEKEK